MDKLFNHMKIYNYNKKLH